MLCHLDGLGIGMNLKGGEEDGSLKEKLEEHGSLKEKLEDDGSLKEKLELY